MESRKQKDTLVEAALLESKQRYERLANSLPVMLYDSVLGPDGTSRFLYVAPGPCRELLELDPDALLKDMSLIWEIVHPEDVNRFHREDLAANRSGKVFTSEVRIVTSSGHLKWLLVNSRPNSAAPGEPVVWSGFLQDITARKQAEKEREQYFSFFQTSADLKCIADPHGFFLKVNPAFKETLGYSEDELFSKPILEFVHPEDRQATLDEIARQQQKGFTDKFENRYLCKDGSVKWFSWRVNVSKGEGIVYATARDITEWKKADEALRASRNLLQTVLESVPIHVFWKDTESNYLGCNISFARAAGFSQPEDLIGKDDFQMCWREQAELYRADDKRIMTAGRPVIGIEEPQTAPDGHTLRIRTSKVPLHDAEGKVFGLLGIFEDITERKDAEEILRSREAQLRGIFEASQAGIILVDPQGKITFANNSMAVMFGVSLDKLIGNPYAELIYPAEKKTGENLMRKLIQGEIQSVLIERHYIRADGSDFWGLLSGKRLEDSDGSLQSLVGVIADITEQKTLQEQLAQAQKIESVGRLAGGVAHDFNNMLSVILGHVDLAQKKEVSSPMREHLAHIQKAAERSADIVRQLLAFARKQTVSPRVLDLNETVQSMLRMLRRLIGEEIDLVWQPEEALWPVRFDPAQIDQILANLCINAKDAIAGIGKITIETANQSCGAADCAGHTGLQPGDYVLLAVSDDGCGIDQEILKLIFEPFFTTKELGKGTGLGLSTVYGIVKQNAGYIDVYSEPGQGTSFKIYLPRYLGREKQAQTEEPMAPAERGGETVLLVEDETAILDVGKQILELQGYRVLAATTPGEAIRLAEEHHGEIHLLMTDVVMPEMNGRELARELLALYPGLKRLFMSGYTADVIAHHGVIDEGVPFLQKPFTFDALAAKVREVLDQKSE